MSDPADYDEWEADDAKRVRECQDRGLVIVRPAPDELFVDIDSDAQYGTFDRARRRIGSDLIAGFTEAPSPSGRVGRKHITVKLTRPVKDAEERVLLQALLGSDLMRELLSYLRLEADMPDATIFFEKAP